MSLHRIAVRSLWRTQKSQSLQYALKPRYLLPQTCIRHASSSNGHNDAKSGTYKILYRKGLITVQQVNDWISNAENARDAIAIFHKFIKNDHAPPHTQNKHMVDANVPTFIYVLDKVCEDAQEEPSLAEEAFAIYTQAVRQSVTLDMKSYEQLMQLALVQRRHHNESSGDRHNRGVDGVSNGEKEKEEAEEEEEGAVGMDVEAMGRDMIETLRQKVDSRMKNEGSAEALRGYLHMNKQALSAEMDSAVSASISRKSCVILPNLADDKEFYTTSRNALGAHHSIPQDIVKDITSRQQIHRHLDQLPPYRVLKSHPMITRAVSLVQQCRVYGLGHEGMLLLPDLFACCLQHHDTRSAVLALQSLVSMMNNIHQKSFVQTSSNASTRASKIENKRNGDQLSKEGREKMIRTLFVELFVDLLVYHSHQLEVVNQSINELHNQYGMLHKRWKEEIRLQDRDVIHTKKFPTIETQTDGLQLSTLDVYLQRIKFDMSYIGYQLWQSVTSLKWSLTSPEGPEISSTQDYKELLADNSLVWLRGAILQQPEGRFALDNFVASIDEKLASRISDIFGSFVKRYKQKRRSVINLLEVV